MNILVLTSVYPQPDDATRDVTATVKYFCRQWSDAGHIVVVIHNNSVFPTWMYKVPNRIQTKLSSKMGHAFPNIESKSELRYNDEGIDVYRFPMNKMLPYTKYGKKTIRKQVKLIEETLSEIDFVPDVVLCHWVNPQVELVDLLKEKLPAKYSLVFHGDCEGKQIRQFRLKEIIKDFDAVGCRNIGYACTVQKKLGLSKTPFVCSSGVPNDMAATEYQRIKTRQYNKKKEFVFVGRLVEYKNVDTIIDALSEYYDKAEFVFHIIGEGAEKEKLRQRAVAIGVEKNVIFHGYLSRTEAFDMLKKSFCFIMVSNNETFGMVYLEAMLAGCITVASRGCGIDGIIKDGNNGFLSDQGNVSELIKVLKKIDALNDTQQMEIRKEAVRTAYFYRDEEVARRYLNDVLVWKV